MLNLPKAVLMAKRLEYKYVLLK